jgi:hypothetical protein
MNFKHNENTIKTVASIVGTIGASAFLSIPALALLNPGVTMSSESAVGTEQIVAQGTIRPTTVQELEPGAEQAVLVLAQRIPVLDLDLAMARVACELTGR